MRTQKSQVTKRHDDKGRELLLREYKVPNNIKWLRKVQTPTIKKQFLYVMMLELFFNPDNLLSHPDCAKIKKQYPDLFSGENAPALTVTGFNTLMMKKHGLRERRTQNYIKIFKDLHLIKQVRCRLPDETRAKVMYEIGYWLQYYTKTEIDGADEVTYVNRYRRVKNLTKDYEHDLFYTMC